MKTNRRGCKCKCELWDICVCECECKAHRTLILDKEFWDKQEKKKLFFRSLRKKKEKQELEQNIDSIVFGYNKEEQYAKQKARKSHREDN